MEQRASQRVIQTFGAIVFMLLLIVPGIDHRLEWSHMPVWTVFIGDLLIASGFAVVFAAFRENAYTSATITVEKEQAVASTGPYALVRHPMYAGALVLLLGMPLALGSWIAMLLWPAICLVIVLRLLDEERYLRKNLRGHEEYCSRVSFRLMPYVF